jgi:hypothetical protein
MMSDIVIDEGMIVLEPRSRLDEAIIGREEDKLVYSYTKLIEVFMSQGMTYFESIDWIEFNIIGAYVAGWPIIKDDLNE